MIAHQWIIYGERVPSESKQLIKPFILTNFFGQGQMYYSIQLFQLQAHFRKAILNAL